MNINPIDNKQENRYWENSQLDDIVESLEKRGITIKNSINISKVVTSNSTIMEYAIKYARIKQQKDDFISNINHIRTYK